MPSPHSPSRPISRQPNRSALAVACVVAAVLLAVLIVPKWRRATACAVGGGRWGVPADASFMATGCTKQSPTAGKACTGQLPDECAGGPCDLAAKQCPATYVKSFYTKEGKYYVR